MPRSNKQNEAMRLATQQAILSSAMRLFAQNGYAHTSIRKIATEAEISAGLMYHYYPSKEALLEAVFNQTMQQIDEALEPIILSQPPGRRVQATLEKIFAMLDQDPQFWQLFYTLRSQPAIMEILGDGFRVRTMALRQFFEGEFIFAGHPTPRIQSYIVYSLIEGTIQQYLLEPSAYPLQEVVDGIYKQIMEIK